MLDSRTQEIKSGCFYYDDNSGYHAYVDESKSIFVKFRLAEKKTSFKAEDIIGLAVEVLREQGEESVGIEEIEGKSDPLGNIDALKTYVAQGMIDFANELDPEAVIRYRNNCFKKLGDLQSELRSIKQDETRQHDEGNIQIIKNEIEKWRETGKIMLRIRKPAHGEKIKVRRCPSEFSLSEASDRERDRKSKIAEYTRSSTIRYSMFDKNEQDTPDKDEDTAYDVTEAQKEAAEIINSYLEPIVPSKR